MPKILNLSAMAAAALLCGCDQANENNQAPEQPGGNESPQLPENAAPTTGVDSQGNIYSAVTAQGDEGREVASEGSGEMQEMVSTQAEMNSLLALQPLEGFAPSVIIGADDRTKIANTTTFPERAQVLVALPGGRCSGALVGKDLVLTAGHCVHRSGQWATGATVYPGKNGAASPFGSCRAKKFYSVVGWTKKADPNYDFGAIKLDCDVGNRTGWLGFYWQNGSLVNTAARISSYPGDKPLEQWTHTGKVGANTATKTFYLTDTVGGNSGSAVFAQVANCGPCAHTAHAYGSAQSNSGTRISQALFENLKRWKAEQ